MFKLPFPLTLSINGETFVKIPSYVQVALLIDADNAQPNYIEQVLTRSLKQLIGQTPAQIIDGNTSQQLSYLFKTDALAVNVP